ncbi:MAG: nuclear transport factor 2 family protein [Chloroflexota bacterium]|nr:nuclear transport factor 2 family protein [Chloroflexota bacterium]
MDELDDFLRRYEQAANSRNLDQVAPLIAENAIFWFINGVFVGRAAIKVAFEDTWATILDERYSITNIRWVGRSATLAVCAYSFRSDGIVNGQRQIYAGHGTNVIEKRDGQWLMTHEHLSGGPEDS